MAPSTQTHSADSSQQDSQPSSSAPISSPAASDASAQATEEKVLCPHCRRTASNGIKCQGICVADSDY